MGIFIIRRPQHTLSDAAAKRAIQRVRALMHERNVHSSLRPQSDQLFCLFTGNAGLLNINPVDFIRRTGIAQSNILIFRDPYDACYQQGISPECSSLDGIAAWIGAQLDGPLSHVRDIFCAGTSSGGLPAIHVGYHRAARAVWSLGGRVARPSVVAQRERLANEVYLRVLGHSKPCPLTKAEKVKLREAVATPALTRRVQDVTDPRLLNDRELMAPLLHLLARNEAQTRFHFYYAITNAIDRGFAETFQGCSFVTLHPVVPPSAEPEDESDPFNDPDHLVVPMLEANGALEDLFSAYLPKSA